LQQAWKQVAALAQNERLGLLIDEFTYLLEIDPSIAGQDRCLLGATRPDSDALRQYPHTSASCKRPALWNAACR